MSYTPEAAFAAYLETIKRPFIKLARLRFLNPDGSTAFALDNTEQSRLSGAFISEGSLTVNLQNGCRRTAEVTLSNVDHRFDFDINNVWFGQEIALDEGVVLPDGTEYYIQQGIFLADTPTETLEPNNRIMTYNLTDKWAMLDGTLYGNLEGTYEVPLGTNIYNPIISMLAEDRGNGLPVDRVTPVFTEYYNDKTQALPSDPGTQVSVLLSPYTLRVDGDNGTLADVVLGLMEMLNAWVGYDRTGALTVEPSQDDILDSEKPLAWRFDMGDTRFLGASYTIRNTEVYNDYIVVGEMMDDNSQPKGRAQNNDPTSPTNIQTIGRKTVREQRSGFATDKQCEDLAVWRLKRVSVLQSAVSISCGQILHLRETELVELVREDKPGSPVETHLIMGFTRPISGLREMTIEAVSVFDLADVEPVSPEPQT